MTIITILKPARFLTAALFALAGLAMLAAAAVMPAGPAGAPAAHAASKGEVRRLIEQAEALRQQAAALEFEWRYTKKRIKDAQEALAAGKLDEAEKHAKRAKREAELAIEQAATAEKVWEIAVPK